MFLGEYILLSIWPVQGSLLQVPGGERRMSENQTVCIRYKEFYTKAAYSHHKII